MLVRLFHASCRALDHPKSWTLPDLDRLPGAPRQKTYSKNENILQPTSSSSPVKRHLTPPPKGWRKMANLPQYMRTKYALREQALKKDLSTTKRVSRAAMNGIRILHEKYPDELPSWKLAQFFRISPVAVSKILRSKWQPDEQRLVKERSKWEERGRKLIQRQMIDSRLEEFFSAKEKQLKMEIPEPVRNELADYIYSHGTDDLEAAFNELNDARVHRQRMKEPEYK